MEIYMGNGKKLEDIQFYQFLVAILVCGTTFTETIIKINAHWSYSFDKTTGSGTIKTKKEPPNSVKAEIKTKKVT
jgi:hypothetical protein